MMFGTSRLGSTTQGTHSLLYRSVALIPPGDVLLDIVRTAERENAARGLSGMLCYSRTRYLQLIEGPLPALDRLWLGLSRDRRHRILWVDRSPRAARRIPAALPMGYASTAQLLDLDVALDVADTGASAGALADVLGALAHRIYPVTCGADA
jgi:hypothetical protein